MEAMFQVGYKEKCVRSLMSLHTVQRLAPWLAARLCNPNSSLLREFTIDFHGYYYRGLIKNHLDWCAYFLESFAVAEAAFVEAVANYARRQGQRLVCLDIGANVGLRTLMMAKVADDVLAFEAIPGAFERLQEKVTSNQLKHVRCFAAVIDERAGELELEVLSPTNFKAVRKQYPFADSAFGSLTVPAIHGDDFLRRQEVDLPNFIRMDSRSDVTSTLRGLSETLRQSRPIVLLERPSINSGEAIDEGSLRSLLYDDVDIVAFDENLPDGSFSIVPLRPTSRKLVCFPSALGRSGQSDREKVIDLGLNDVARA